MEGGTGGGQTKENVSGWTVDTLHAHILALFGERDSRYMARFAAAEVAVGKAEANTKEWQKASNEWRGAMQDKDKLQMSRPEITSELNSVRSSISTIRALSLSAILVCCSVITVILLIVRPIYNAH